MRRKLFFAVAILLAVALSCAGFVLGKKVPFHEQWPLYEALRNTASIIFAVVGAWLAIIYPERLKLSFRNGSGKGEAGADKIGLLLVPAVHSTFLLAALLLIGVVAPLLQQIPLVMERAELWRGCSFALLCVLTSWQMAIVGITLFPAEQLHSASQREAALESIGLQRGKLQRGPSGPND